jgi:hypothetical protein
MPHPEVRFFKLIKIKVDEAARLILTLKKAHRPYLFNSKLLKFEFKSQVTTFCRCPVIRALSRLCVCREWAQCQDIIRRHTSALGPRDTSL